MTKQRDTFLNKEGDNWFRRNQAHPAVSDMSKDPVVEALKLLNPDGKRILEIGCADGFRPAYLHEHLDVEAFGLDPSSEAIDMGRTKHPMVDLQTGTADKLTYEDGFFDVIIYGFCLYLCDREDLFRIAAEGDRVLKTDGNIVIMDFITDVPYYNPYHHLEGLKSYKMDYSKLFTWNPAYTLVRRNILPHPDSATIGNFDDRIGVDTIQRETNPYPSNPYKNDF